MEHKLITWNEFKKEVEKLGVREDTTLRYIDINFPLDVDPEYTFSIKVNTDSNNSICIVNE